MPKQNGKFPTQSSNYDQITTHVSTDSKHYIEVLQGSVWVLVTIQWHNIVNFTCWEILAAALPSGLCGIWLDHSAQPQLGYLRRHATRQNVLALCLCVGGETKIKIKLNLKHVISMDDLFHSETWLVLVFQNPSVSSFPDVSREMKLNSSVWISFLSREQIDNLAEPLGSVILINPRFILKGRRSEAEPWAGSKPTLLQDFYNAIK